jgi:hypothetical protein
MRGLEHLEAALAAGKGAVLCDAHFGSIYSCCSLIGARGFPITAVGNWKSNPIMSLVERLAFWRVGIAKRRPRHLRRPNIEPRRGQEAPGQVHLRTSNLRTRHRLPKATREVCPLAQSFLVSISS